MDISDTYVLEFDRNTGRVVEFGFDTADLAEQGTKDIGLSMTGVILIDGA